MPSVEIVTDIPRITAIAEATRVDFENSRISLEELFGYAAMHDRFAIARYQAQFAGKETIGFTDGNSKGYCEPASLMLLGRIGAGSCQPGIYDTGIRLADQYAMCSPNTTIYEAHTIYSTSGRFDDVAPGTIVASITDDQYGGPRVFVGPVEQCGWETGAISVEDLGYFSDW